MSDRYSNFGSCVISYTSDALFVSLFSCYLLILLMLFFLCLFCRRFCSHLTPVPALHPTLYIDMIRAEGVSTEGVDAFSPGGDVDFDWQYLEGALVLLGAAGRCQHCFATVEEVRRCMVRYVNHTGTLLYE